MCITHIWLQERGRSGSWRDGGGEVKRRKRGIQWENIEKKRECVRVCSTDWATGSISLKTERQRSLLTAMLSHTHTHTHKLAYLPDGHRHGEQVRWQRQTHAGHKPAVAVETKPRDHGDGHRGDRCYWPFEGGRGVIECVAIISRERGKLERYAFPWRAVASMWFMYSELA